MSLWDLEPIDEDRRPNSVNRLPVLPSEIVETLYRPRPEDWGGDRDSECDRISAGLGQVMEFSESEPFSSPVDLNLQPTYGSIVEYPMDLSTIKARLDNRFYRRASAVEFDWNYIFTNPHKFNLQPESDIVRSASVITDLCLELIRNRNAVDVQVIYEQLLKKYELRYEGDDQNGPGTSGAEAASTSHVNRHLQKSHTGETQRLHGEEETSNCELSLSESNGSNVESNNLLLVKF